MFGVFDFIMCSYWWKSKVNKRNFFCKKIILINIQQIDVYDWFLFIEMAVLKNAL